MLITSVCRSDGGNEYTVRDDTGAKYVITQGDLKRCGIPFYDSSDEYPFEIPEEKRSYLNLCADKLRCVKYLQWYISNYGEKSKKRLLEKCRENGYTRECAEKAIGILCEFSVIDEVSACERRISAYANDKLYGKFRIRTELMAKGYERACIDEALKLVEVDFYENAARMYAKLTKNGIPDDIRDKKKIADKMVRYGYSFDEINYASSCDYDGDF